MNLYKNWTQHVHNFLVHMLLRFTERFKQIPFYKIQEKKTKVDKITHGQMERRKYYSIKIITPPPPIVLLVVI